MDALLDNLTREKIKNAIPQSCFRPSVVRSIAYFFYDIYILSILYLMAWHLNSWLFYPLFWFLSGTMLWAVFVIGHDCGHGSFSRYSWLNYLVGYLSHSPILVPFHGWKVSHRKHHLNTGSFENEEAHTVVSYSEYIKRGKLLNAIQARLVLFAFPVYLLGFRNKNHMDIIHESHFVPSSGLFTKEDKVWVSLGTFFCLLCLTGYIALGVYFGLKFFFNFIFMPYLVFCMWLSFVTYLHHTSPEVPLYRTSAWTNLRGALSTMDYDYGFFNKIHHHIELHIVHHLFPAIPHYHLVKATEAIKPILGRHYKISPHSPLTAYLIAQKNCRFVEDTGDIVFQKSLANCEQANVNALAHSQDII